MMMAAVYYLILHTVGPNDTIRVLRMTKLSDLLIYHNFLMYNRNRQYLPSSLVISFYRRPIDIRCLECDIQMIKVYRPKKCIGWDGDLHIKAASKLKELTPLGVVISLMVVVWSFGVCENVRSSHQPHQPLLNHDEEVSSSDAIHTR